MGLIFFIIAIGFVSAALLSNLVQLKTDDPNDFYLPVNNGPRMVLVFIICMFSGPYLVIRNAIVFANNFGMPPYVLGCCFGVSILWSLCSGILIVQTLTLIGVIGI